MKQLSFACHHRFPGGFELNLAFDCTHNVTCLFGPSGSGKTTVLSMIAGMSSPQQGRIRLGERILVDTAQRINVPTHERHVGVVFQDHLLFPHLSVEANLRFGEGRRNATGPEISLQRVVEVLELQDLLPRRPRFLSGGQRQRVALGRALLSRPDLLLMDEPLAALDEALKVRILDYLERVFDEWHIPTLFVSHSQAEVRRLSDWVVVVEHGRLVTEGSPDEALGQSLTLSWKDAVGPVNLLKIQQVETREGQLLGHLEGQSLTLPFDSLADHHLPIFVQFGPGDVMLSCHDVRGLSARNHLRGRVRQLVQVPNGVFVAVDVGQIVWSEVTQESVAELDLHVGDEVFCFVKTHSLQIV